MKASNSRSYVEHHRGGSGLPCARAFTLVETLLTLILSTCVVVVAGTMTVQVAKSSHVLEEELADQWRRTQVFRRFAEDVEQRITWLPDDVSPVHISVNGLGVELFSLAVMPEPDAVTTRRFPAKIVYSIREDSMHPGRKQLIRTVRDLTMSDHQYSRVLIDDLVSATVEVLVDNEWTFEVDPEATKTDRPWKAVRLVCAWADSEFRRPSSRTVMLRNADGKRAKNR